MSKDTTFIGQPIFLQVIKLLSKSDISTIERKNKTNRYTKKFDGYNHLVTLLFSILANCDSLREVVVGMLSLSNKLQHLGLSYIVKRTRSRMPIADVAAVSLQTYIHIYTINTPEFYRTAALKTSKNSILWTLRPSHSSSRYSKELQSEKKKGGMKVHTLIASDENIPQLAIMTSAATHDHIMLKKLNLQEGSFVVFDRGYVDYAVYESFSEKSYYCPIKTNIQKYPHITKAFSL